MKAKKCDSLKTASSWRQYHDGRPRGPLWRGKKLIGKEALFVILGLERFKDDEDKLHKFIKTHALRLLKMDMIAVLIELERQEQVSRALMMFKVMRKQDLLGSNHCIGKTYTEGIRGFLNKGSPADAMNIYQDMKNSPVPPDECHSKFC
ncbi:unnamed protein product [Sphenostylis stenocarpa]|uniref:Pentatricopeptide repeat-containing protein n=1 Tax=Sphenostylis stenocarpa TaxID=92480 RepID=A0AA86VD20_9FABA|nr:unnamed protein product [Sphenostylis stenocarpa]